jgi:hypothetical protein
MREHEFDQLAKRIKAEVTGDAAKIAERLFPSVPPGMEKLSEEEFLGRVRANWGAPEYRQELLGKVGPKNFLNISRKAFGITEDAYNAAKHPMSVLVGEPASL